MYQSKNDLEILLENTGFSAVLTDLKGRIISANANFCEFLCYEEDEIIGQNIDDLQFEDDINLDNDLFNDLINEKIKYYKFQKRFIRKDEQIVWGDINLSIKKENDNIECVIGIIDDISSKKEMEEVFRLNQQFLETLMDNSPDSVYFKDITGRFIKVNKTTVRKLGSEKEEDVLGKTDFDFFDDEHAQNAFDDEQEIIETEIPLLAIDEKETWPDGKVTWGSTSKLPYYDANGEIIGTFGITRDITKQKELEKIQWAQFKISEAANTTPDMDTLYRIIHDVIKELMPAKNFYIALHDQETDLISFPYFIDEFDPTPKTRKFGNGLTEFVIKKGEVILLDKENGENLINSGRADLIGTIQSIWLGAPLIIDDKIIGVITVQDYADTSKYGEEEKNILMFVSGQVAQAIQRKSTQEKLTQSSEALKLLNATKDKFFSIIAHDLKNPFTTLMGFSDMLLHEYHEMDDAEKLKFITAIRDSSKFAHKLLENLLDWSRAQTGSIEYKPKEFNICELIESNIKLLEFMASNKKIDLEFSANKEIKVFADHEMIDTVLRNLITNAIKFSGRNKKIITDCVYVDKFVQISIVDQGIGMDEKQIDELFRLDVNHSTHGTEEEKGTGLGLILCKEFIEKNGGKIWVESKPNIGSKFHFKIPTA